MADLAEYTLGEDYTAEAAYSDLQSKRQAVLDMGRRMAELTIPSVMPPEGYESGDDLPGNNQSYAAGAVNTLASALMFMAFPPGLPIMNLSPQEWKLQGDIDADPELYANVQLGLSRLELAHREGLAATALSSAYVGYLKLLLIAGNAMWKHIKFEEPTFHRPDSYVVRRSPGGHPLVTIHKEEVVLATLDEDHREQIRGLLNDSELTDNGKAKREWDIKLEVYSVCKLKVTGSGDNVEKTWLYWQEFRGHVLEGTEVETDYEDCPMWPGWLIPVYGSNWGRSYCEEYRGDLYSLEAHSSALNDGASVAALSLIFVKPGQTSIKQIREARNLSTISGSAEDISMFRSEKTGDFNFVLSTIETIVRRLGNAFLMQSSIQRSGERVTAEEIRRLGAELDKALGGLYTQIAQGNQRVVVLRAIHLHEETNADLPPIPREVVSIKVITGVDAMGRSSEADQLSEYAATGRAAFPNSFEKVHNPINFFTRYAAAKGIKPDGLILKPDQLQAQNESEQQQAMMQTLMDKGAGPAVKGMADFANQGGDLESALTQQQQGGPSGE